MAENQEIIFDIQVKTGGIKESGTDSISVARCETSGLWDERTKPQVAKPRNNILRSQIFV